MDMPVQVPVDDPNADTEWNDILRQHNVIPPKPPSPTAEIESALQQARDIVHANRLEHKTLDELDSLEDSEDEDFLNSYRQRRIDEMASLQKSSRFGAVVPLQKNDYTRDVTEASREVWVLVLMTSPVGSDESKVAEEGWKGVARKFGDVKFCVIRADLCVEGYPEKNCPTVLCYRDGDIRRHVVTLKELKGLKTGVDEWERLLVELGAVERGDIRLLHDKKSEDGRPQNGALRQGKNQTAATATNGSKDEDEADSDWD